MQADLKMAAFGIAPTQEEVVDRLRGMARRCPQFYPAIVELGLRLLSMKGGPGAERMIQKGFRLMLELAGPKHCADEIDGVVENLESMWRFDVSKRLLEFLAESRRLSASQHDSLAHAAARLGDIAAALSHIGYALRLEPRSKNFLSNKGLYHLMGGELKEAGIALHKASQLAPKDPVVLGNLTICEYLGEHGGDYFDYLLRPLDRRQIDRWADQEKWDKVDGMCTDFSDCRMEAFAQATFLKGGKERSRLPRLLATLRMFFHFVSRVDSSGIFLNEDIDLVHTNFKPIMHKFIFKFRDVDRETMDDVFEGLKAYYGFLASRQLVAAADFKQFGKSILGMKDELLDKMKRYNAIRHDATVDEERKEELREELFEGDHAWPHL